MRYSKDCRALCVRAYLRMRSLRKTSSLLGISKSSIQRWVSGCPIIQRERQARKVTESAVQLISDIVKSNPFDTPAAISEKLQNALKLHVSSSTIRFWMKRSGITRKKAFRVVQHDDLVVSRTSFAKEFISFIDPERVVSVDESSIYFDMKPDFGYCHRSKRLNIPARRGGRVRWSLIMAVTDKRVVGWKLVQGAVNSSAFADFMLGLQTDERDVILLDNASTHKTTIAIDAMLSRGMTPYFLPPYTPEFQPIEHCFSVLKGAFKRTSPSGTAKTASEMLGDVAQRLEGCMTRLTSEVLTNQFGACRRRALSFALSASVLSPPNAPPAPPVPPPDAAAAAA